MDEQVSGVSENTGHEGHLSRRYLPRRSRFAALPPFRLAYTIVLSSLLLPSFLIFIYSWGWDRRSVGIQVSVLRQGSYVDYSTMPMLVRIDGNSLPPHLYLNSTPVVWGELASDLRDQLKLRPDRVVYVEADEHVSWADVMNAVDIIRGTNTNVVLLTAKTTRVPAR
jgi:biopolymer transport protein ExbD